MEEELSSKIDQLIALLIERNQAQKDFEARLLEEMRALNRSLSNASSRQTVGDL